MRLCRHGHFVYIGYLNYTSWDRALSYNKHVLCSISYLTSFMCEVPIYVLQFIIEIRHATALRYIIQKGLIRAEYLEYELRHALSFNNISIITFLLENHSNYEYTYLRDLRSAYFTGKLFRKAVSCENHAFIELLLRHGASELQLMSLLPREYARARIDSAHKLK